MYTIKLTYSGNRAIGTCCPNDVAQSEVDDVSHGNLARGQSKTIILGWWETACAEGDFSGMSMRCVTKDRPQGALLISFFRLCNCWDCDA
jgi:hypothetical protein